MGQKKKFAILIGLSLLAVLVLRLPQRELSGTGALETLLLSTGAAVMEGEIQYYATLEDSYLEMSELEEILLQVSDLLGLQGGLVQYSEGETYRVLDVSGKTTQGTDTHIVVQSNPGEENSFPPQTYLLITCRDTSLANINTLADRLNVVIQPLAPGGRLSYYLSGELPGRLSSQEMSDMADKALTSVRGQVIEGLWQDDLVSLTAYTPLLEQYLAADGDRFNLNLAIRYDSYHDKTILWAGYPIIHSSY
ncbi:MAG: YwmB family TATA-box binding protein [Clostridiales bacterium]|nr:YwmB family TATA-box binding protein [Clostridiales bacterium]